MAAALRGFRLGREWQSRGRNQKPRGLPTLRPLPAACREIGTACCRRFFCGHSPTNPVARADNC